LALAPLVSLSAKAAEKSLACLIQAERATGTIR
jgi:hypothetical protein